MATAAVKVLKELIELGKELGYEGDDIQTFVTSEREATKRAEAAEREAAAAEKAAEREAAEKAAKRVAAENAAEREAAERAEQRAVERA